MTKSKLELMLRHNFVRPLTLLSRIEDLPISLARQNELKNLVDSLANNPFPQKSLKPK